MNANQLHAFVLTAHKEEPDGTVKEEFIGSFEDEWLAKHTSYCIPWPAGVKGFYQLEYFSPLAEHKIKIRNMNPKLDSSFV